MVKTFQYYSLLLIEWYVGGKRRRRKKSKQLPSSDTTRTIFDFMNHSFAESGSGQNSSRTELLKDIIDVPRLPLSTTGALLPLIPSHVLQEGLISVLMLLMETVSSL